MEGLLKLGNTTDTALFGALAMKVAGVQKYFEAIKKLSYI